MRAAALIFDVDGTLSETEELHRQAFNETFASFGLPWRWDRAAYRELLQVTGGKERIASFVATLPDGGGQAVERIAEIHAAKTQRYTERAAAGALSLRPGIARLIAQARQHGVRLAIATTTSLPNVEALLRSTLGVDAPAAFEVIGAGDVVAAKKPAADIYTYVLERLALRPDECVAFEDSGNGLKAAIGAGIPTVITPGIYTGDDDFCGALAVLSDLGEADAPYRHLAGSGGGDRMVTLEALARWRAAP